MLVTCAKESHSIYIENGEGNNNTKVESAVGSLDSEVSCELLGLLW